MHDPDSKIASNIVLPQDIAHAVPVQVRDPDNPPIKSKCHDESLRKNRSAIHKPDIHFAGLRVTPKDILFAVSIEITLVTEKGCDYRPRAWSRRGRLQQAKDCNRI